MDGGHLVAVKYSVLVENISAIKPRLEANGVRTFANALMFRWGSPALC